LLGYISVINTKPTLDDIITLNVRNYIRDNSEEFYDKGSNSGRGQG
jgi:hypothetical protein